MFSSRFFSAVSIFLAFLIFSRTAFCATSTLAQVESNIQVQELQAEQQVAYEMSTTLGDTTNLSSFNQDKYSCSEDGECEEQEEAAPCKACAIASGMNSCISVCSFVIAVVAMVIAAFVIANAGDNNNVNNVAPAQ